MVQTLSVISPNKESYTTQVTQTYKFWNDASKIEFEIYSDVSGNILFRMPINGIMAVRNIFAVSVRGTDERIIAVSYVKFCTDAHH